jgi:hypothetical protein
VDMLTSRFEEFLRNFNWNQCVHSFQPWRAHPPDEPKKGQAASALSTFDVQVDSVETSGRPTGGVGRPTPNKRPT